MRALCFFIYKKTLSQDCHHDLHTEKLVWENYFPAMLVIKIVELCLFVVQM